MRRALLLAVGASLADSPIGEAAPARKRQPRAGGHSRAWALAALSAALFLWPATDAAAAVVRLQVDWAPSDGTTVMTPPYLFADSASGSSRHQGICSASPSNCANSPGTRWQDENPDSGGQPRRISFVDDTPTQYSTYTLSISHPFVGFGPNVVGTATITHADGRTHTVPFNLPPASAPFPPERTQLGVSEGLPMPGGGGGGGGGDGTGPQPVLGVSVVVKVKGERVRIRRPGSAKFEELKGTQSVPVGSLLDTLRGKVKLSSATDAHGHKQTAHFAGGIFKVLQMATSPLTTLRLAGKLRGCAPVRARGAEAVAAKWKPRGRRLWGSGTGSFRTSGRRSAATVTGTRWLVADLCDGSTLTRVKSGTVDVRDFARKRTISLEQGEEYVARPPGRR
jgi:hypothetical protein